ncbi:hypothetical protein [Mesorhizobium sp. IMUNJ 23232]|uniref:hypothetical protein n=1 Tax=Mesorhizobium sp. IMUNJ 23232 TaxID=3376064 RepID=UPI00378D1A01
MAITRGEIVSTLGPVDDEVVAELMGTGASAEELREAWAWLHNDEALMGVGRPLPGTRVGRLIQMLEPDEDEASRTV